MTYILKKVEGDLNKIIDDKQSHWDGEHYVYIQKDALLDAFALIEIDSDTDTPRTIRYCIYRHPKKGLYVKIRKKRVYLKDIGFTEVENG